jgi:DNA primase
MKHDLQQLKQALPLDALMAKLGHGDLCKKSARCPFHEDTRNSFSVYDDGTGELRWKCHSGCDGGDVIDFVKKFFNLPDSRAAIKQYAELAGNPVYIEAARSFRGKVKPSKVVKETDATLTPARLDKLTDKSCEKIAKWRGLTPGFVKEMSEAGILGLFESKPAFVTEGGVQFRLPNDGWRFSPGAKNSVLVIGEPDKGKALFVVESNWDALAIHESSRLPVICTRGASNARLAIDYIGELSGGQSMQIICFPHNDKAGEDFANDLRAGLMLHQFKVKHVPEPYKDFNDYYKASRA